MLPDAQATCRLARLIGDREDHTSGDDQLTGLRHSTPYLLSISGPAGLHLPRTLAEEHDQE